MKLSLGFSPCPNDTFIFNAIVNKKIDTEGLDFNVFLEDVQTLNEWAAQERLDITKLSFPALFSNEEVYSMLSAGAALGKGVGPLLIAKTLLSMPDVKHSRIAIPGENTTANFLLGYALPQAQNKIPMLFSDIETAVLNGSVDLGVIIHENRFTYEQKGLIKVLDLGEYWEKNTGLPIPLGCIAAKKSLGKDLQMQIDSLIQKSIEYAFNHYPLLPDYVKTHSQAMDETVMLKHIELYVNEFSLAPGETGNKAIEKLRQVFLSKITNA
ncbi:MAG: 1,4-dihydroxy-6-naphthoate synthase [Chitinophagaceae bacterium]